MSAFTRALLAVTVLGAVPRLLSLDQALFGDELFTHAIAATPGFGDAMSLMRETENTPPLTYVGAWLLAQVLEPTLAVRILPVAAGIATTYVTGVLAGRAFGPRVGIAAAALCAVSAMSVYYGAEARAYSVAASATVVSTLAVARGLDARGARWWVVAGVSGAVAVWSHYTAVFPLAAQFGWVLYAHPGRWRPLVASHGGAAVAYLPWLPFLTANEGRDVLASLSPVNRETVIEVPTRWLLGSPYLGITNLPGRPGLWVLGACAVIAGVMLARERPRLRLRDPGGLVVVTALAAPALVFAYSVVGDSIWNPRNLLVSLPAALTVVAALLMRRGAWGVAIAIVAIAVYTVGGARMVGSAQRPPYDELAEVVDRWGRPQDPVIEHQVLVAGGPLREAVSIWFDRPHPEHVFATDADVARAWDDGVRSGRVLVVAAVGGLPGQDEPAGVDPRFRLERRVVARGLFDVAVWEYVPR